MEKKKKVVLLAGSAAIVYVAIPPKVTFERIDKINRLVVVSIGGKKFNYSLDENQALQTDKIKFIYQASITQTGDRVTVVVWRNIFGSHTPVSTNSVSV